MQFKVNACYVTFLACDNTSTATTTERQQQRHTFFTHSQSQPYKSATLGRMANSNLSSSPTNNSNNNNNNNAMIKLCHVCGDKAIAFNFNGLTCESCKSFFRRNAFKLNKFKCNRNDNCKIELINRKYCQACRLKRCFEIGMKKELVLDRKRKHEQRKEGSSSPSAISSSRLIELLKETEVFTTGPEDDDLENEIVDINIPFVNEQAGALELNDYEQSIVTAVNEASSVFVEEVSLQVRGEATSFKQGCNLPGLYVRKIIRFAKNIPQFKLLNKNDQLIIIKPFFTEILLIRFGFAYNYEHDAISVIENEVEQNTIWLKVDLLKEANRHSFALIYRKYMFAAKMEFEDDTTMRNLLATISLFRPRDSISCPEFIKYYHTLYKRILGRYLEHKYRDVQKAMEKFDKLMAILEKAYDITQPITELYTLLDIKEISGVLHEIYLK